MSSAATSRTGGHWPWIVVALLLGNSGAVGVLIALSGSGDSHHVVPDYYEKAIAWDDTMAQERANLALGWSVELAGQAEEGAGGDGGVLVTVTVRDRAGAPVQGATLELEAFHRGRAGAILRARPLEVGGGLYRIRLPIARAGLWQVALTATRGPEVFTATVVRDLGPAGPEGGGA